MPDRDSLAHVSSVDQPDRMLPEDDHARQHACVRKAHETERLEDYVELIADLIDAKGEARPIEIARRLDVRQATVSQMTRRLCDQGLVTTAPYQPIKLTESGRQTAVDSRIRHAVVLAFLRALGIPEETARADAEGIEHHVSDATLAAMRAHIEAITPRE